MADCKLRDCFCLSVFSRSLVRLSTVLEGLCTSSLSILGVDVTRLSPEGLVMGDKAGLRAWWPAEARAEEAGSEAPVVKGEVVCRW